MKRPKLTDEQIAALIRINDPDVEFPPYLEDNPAYQELIDLGLVETTYYDGVIPYLSEAGHAALVALQETKRKRIFGLMAGKVRMSPDFDAPEDRIESMALLTKRDEKEDDRD